MEENQDIEDLGRELDERDRDRLVREINRLLEARGVEFGGAEAHAFRADPVPRVVGREEWDELAAGLRQRARALECFVEDVYGEQCAVADGVVPERVVAGSPYFERDLVGLRPRGGARISVAGLDVVRGDDGRFRVLEDNVRTPSGIAYAMAVSDAVAEVLGVDRPTDGIEAEVPAALRRCLEATAPDVDGELVLLTDGPENSAHYEHRQVAELADLVLAGPADLRRAGDRVVLADGRRVRSVYRRTDCDRMRDERGAPTWVADLLVGPLRAGEVGMVNWFGTGVADDKSVYGYVDGLVRHFLGEEPVVPSVPTYDLLDPARLEQVLDRLADLVVKPRDGSGGDGVVVGPGASPEELERARERVRADPEAWIAQEVVSLSTHPTVVDGRLEPRRVDLRPFAFNDGRDVVVPPGGLTRVALQAGEMVVNSSRDGGGKATWVV